MFEPGPDLWCGRVCQPDGDELLSNVPMEDMSAHTWNAEQGLDRLRQNGLGDHACDTVVPERSQAGQYLVDSAQQTMTTMIEADSRVQIRRPTVDAVVGLGPRAPRTQ